MKCEVESCRVFVKKADGTRCKNHLTVPGPRTVQAPAVTSAHADDGRDPRRVGRERDEALTRVHQLTLRVGLLESFLKHRRTEAQKAFEQAEGKQRKALLDQLAAYDRLLAGNP